jgi:hypothetical protein
MVESRSYRPDGFRDEGCYVICVTQDPELRAHTFSHRPQRYVPKEEKMMRCHYISTQLERIQEAKVGAEQRLSRGGPTGLEEQLQAMESAISSIRVEMRRQERAF